MCKYDRHEDDKIEKRYLIDDPDNNSHGQLRSFIDNHHTFQERLANI
ncbi:MAG: hypothetical protein ABI045_01595 [Flavobacteriales bacterium]